MTSYVRNPQFEAIIYFLSNFIQWTDENESRVFSAWPIITCSSFGGGKGFECGPFSKRHSSLNKTFEVKIITKQGGPR